MSTKVTVPGVPESLNLTGTLCRPGLLLPTTVQLLVHGGTYNQSVWDWPQQPDTYSYVRDAVTAGYATFAVDRIGHGGSDKPSSAVVTMGAAATALHDVVTKLRSGQIGGQAFRRVVWVGHSLGAVVGYDYGGRFSDIDAYAMTGSIHFIKQSWLNLIIANTAPVPGPDPGYLTTVPGSRASLFYHQANADPAVIAQDELLKDTVTGPEIETALGLVLVPPAQSPTRNIRVPVLVALGDHDNLVCDGADGIKCVATEIAALERPYFPNASRFATLIVAGSGHMLSQHRTAPVAHAGVIGWIRGVVPPF
ncbi:MAG TPA: alpha/beta fold hydrolase [Actinophytocola sp.]|uniref:alpha/beta hydrolase n=1 Tax=Actinophytocola sp. TaxID=1872138 RepID=UPI002DB7F159|nr:alpha/beta fold hydrolase [Actinophytocola sp.]HEU5471375.1 alpha/beta fold hydrolase [Actinophytocola sp.]